MGYKTSQGTECGTAERRNRSGKKGSLHSHGSPEVRSPKRAKRKEK